LPVFFCVHDGYQTEFVRQMIVTKIGIHVLVELFLIINVFIRRIAS